MYQQDRTTDLYDNVRQVHNHECSLPLDEDAISWRISSGYFVGLRRKFRRFLTVSPASPESQSFLRSTARIRMEEERHLSKQYYMIHPFSSARTVWEMLMIPVYLLLFIIIPFDIIIIYTPNYLLYSKLILDIISLVDVILFFCTGYYDRRLQKIVINRKEVIKHYIIRFFIFDLISSQPINMYLHLFHKQNFFRLKFFSLLKIVRLPTFFIYLRKFLSRLKIYSYNMSLVAGLMCFLLAIIWGTGILFVLNILNYNEMDMEVFKDAEKLGHFIMMSAHDMVFNLMIVGATVREVMQTSSCLFQVACLVSGFLLYMIGLSQVFRIYNRLSTSGNKYNDLIQQVSEYVKYRQLPAFLKERILAYVEFKYQKNVFKEADILNTLSYSLKQDILLNNCHKLIEKVDFFKDLPTAVMLRIVVKMRPEIFLTGDVIVEAGSPGHSMYFIYLGSVAVYTANGIEICHLEEGSHFGEISVVYNEPRVATVIAVKDCELFRLSRKDFQEAIAPFPQLWKKIQRSASTRLENTRSMTSSVFHQ